KTVSTTLDRETLEQVVVDGFFARTSVDDLPRESRMAGLQEFGLPYASDPVVSKHIARFLAQSLQNVKASEKLAALVGASAGPQGMQEGTELLIEGREFGLVTGRTAEFRFFSSSVRSGDTPGQILPDAERELDDAGLLEVAIPALDVPVGQVVPVRVSPVVTELGILELWVRHTNSDRRWKVEFQVRTE